MESNQVNITNGKMVPYSHMNNYFEIKYTFSKLGFMAKMFSANVSINDPLYQNKAINDMLRI